MERKNKGWTRSEENKVARLTKQGMTDEQIAEEMGRTFKAVQLKRCRLGLAWAVKRKKPRKRRTVSTRNTMTADTEALADLVIKADISKKQKLSMLEALL